MINVGDRLILTEDFINQQWQDKNACVWNEGDEVIVDSFLDAQTIGFRQLLDRDGRAMKLGLMSVEMALTQTRII